MSLHVVIDPPADKLDKEAHATVLDEFYDSVAAVGEAKLQLMTQAREAKARAAHPDRGQLIVVDGCFDNAVISRS